MNQDQIIEAALVYIKKHFHGDSSGHDYYHSERVYHNAMKIAEKEGGNRFLIALSALLHDVDDRKLFGTHENLTNARNFMANHEISTTDIEAICGLIRSVSFSANQTPATIEGKIVQDADRLDAIGAMGIARAFAYGGHKGRTIYDPNKKPELNMTAEEYKLHEGTTINHFYEKLLRLQDMMNTETGKTMAKQRHVFMEQFLEQFLGEWNGTR